MIACCPAHSPFMLSQSASLRGTPHYINARTLSGLPCLTPAVAARPIRRRALYVASAEPSPSEQIVRIKVKSYELPLVKESVSVILAAAKDTDARCSGPVPLPTRIRKYTVLRSPHVNKDAREQFEIRTHSRLFDFHDPSAATIDALMELDLPAGIDVNVLLR